MPHDKNGKLLEVGDLVRGKVYENGELVDKVGQVTSINSKAQACNATVGYIVTQSVLSNQISNASDLEFVHRPE